MITNTDKFTTGEFQEFPEEIAAQAKGGIPVEATTRRIQPDMSPFGYDSFRPRPEFERRTKVIITCPNGTELYYKLTDSQLKMLNDIITNGGWNVTVQYEKPQEWQTF